MKKQKMSLKVCNLLGVAAFLIALRYALPLKFFNFEVPDVDFLPKPYASHENLIFYAALVLMAVFILMRNKILNDINKSKSETGE
ncbi:hypothetical protein AB1A64_13245 [Ruegeria sp. ANG10]|uniref:hypothetical protein n=1 Tax=Ruegeria sp. ANG10 TaxID=3042467 RepID=UPI00345213CE